MTGGRISRSALARTRVVEVSFSNPFSFRGGAGGLSSFRFSFVLITLGLLTTRCRACHFAPLSGLTCPPTCPPSRKARRRQLQRRVCPLIKAVNLQKTISFGQKTSPEPGPGPLIPLCFNGGEDKSWVWQCLLRQARAILYGQDFLASEKTQIADKRKKPDDSAVAGDGALRARFIKVQSKDPDG